MSASLRRITDKEKMDRVSQGVRRQSESQSCSCFPVIIFLHKTEIGELPVTAAAAVVVAEVFMRVHADVFVQSCARLLIYVYGGTPLPFLQWGNNCPRSR